MKMCTNTFCPCCFFFCIFIYSIEIKLFFQFFSPKAPQCGRPHNNWLYRTRLDRVSATNLCYDKNISYTELYTLNHLFFKKILYNHLKRMLLYFLSGVKPRLQLPCLTLKLNFILESKLDLLSKIFLIHISLAKKRH